MEPQMPGVSESLRSVPAISRSVHGAAAQSSRARLLLVRSRLGLSPKSASKRLRRRLVKPLKFSEVVVDPAAGEALRLRLGGGRELLLPASMPIESIAKLVRALEVSA